MVYVSYPLAGAFVGKDFIRTLRKDILWIVTSVSSNFVWPGNSLGKRAAQYPSRRPSGGRIGLYRCAGKRIAEVRE